MRRTGALRLAKKRQNRRDFGRGHGLIAPQFLNRLTVTAHRQAIFKDRQHHVGIVLQCEMLIRPEGRGLRRKRRNFLFIVPEKDDVKAGF